MMAATVLQIRMATADESVACCSCGVEFYSPVIGIRRKDGRQFYCPNGHTQHFTETEAAKLSKQLDAERRRREEAERDAEWQRSAAKNARTQQTKAQNKLKRVTDRVEAGVCIHCNRTFKQLAAHMKCKHGEVFNKPAPDAEARHAK